jgi:hypothetical protein
MMVKSFNFLVSWEYCTMSPDNLTECYQACKDSRWVLTKCTSKKEYDDFWRVGGCRMSVMHASRTKAWHEVGESETMDVKRIEGHK